MEMEYYLYTKQNFEIFRGMGNTGSEIFNKNPYNYFTFLRKFANWRIKHFDEIEFIHVVLNLYYFPNK